MRAAALTAVRQTPEKLSRWTGQCGPAHEADFRALDGEESGSRLRPHSSSAGRLEAGAPSGGRRWAVASSRHGLWAPSGSGDSRRERGETERQMEGGRRDRDRGRDKNREREREAETDGEQLQTWEVTRVTSSAFSPIPTEICPEPGKIRGFTGRQTPPLL